MPAREPKRTYSPAAIETWFDRLTETWENYFSDEELGKAREIYRDSCIREIQLDVGSLVVHRREGREDIYSVVEWDGGKPMVRSGTTDKFEGRALAAAGLYEVEELVSTEVSPLPPDEKTLPPQTMNATATATAVASAKVPKAPDKPIRLA